MIKKITYIATDGTEFTKESECKEYENAIYNLFSGFTFFDFEQNIVDKNQSIYSLLNESKYFYVNDSLSVEKLIFNLDRIQEYESLFSDFKRVPTKFLRGLWFYDENKWVSYDALKVYYNDLEKEFRIKIANT